ncbi:MAG TPA: hypothetical protein VJH23_05265 [archaeon]|nr:hypothetical protein [archaeon]
MGRNMTMALKDKTFEIMKKHPEIKWTEIARQAIEKKAMEVEMENDEWRRYAMKRAYEDKDWTDADELIDY